MKIVFFTEAGTNIGYGHLTRCYSFFQAFEHKGFQPLLIVKSDVVLDTIVDSPNIQLFDWHSKVEETKSILNDTDIAIFDTYLVSPDLLVEYSANVKLPVFIDDFLRLQYPRGIVFNGAIGAECLPFPFNNQVEYILGASFQPVRSDFWNSLKRQHNERIQRIFLTVGGNDIHGILPVLVDEILKFGYEIEVVCGNNEKMKQWVEQKNQSSLRAHFNLSATQMRQLMYACDIAVSAAGQTLYELAATGLPTIAFSVADNQQTNLEGWTNAGFVFNAGNCKNSDFLSQINIKLKEIENIERRKESSKCGQTIVTGNGGLAAINAILKNFTQKNLYLRKADESDIDAVYLLSNDVTVRAQSFNQEKIEYENHVRWFRNKLIDENCLFLICTLGNTFAGQVRYQVEGDKAIIGISIESKFRGFGLGEQMLVHSRKMFQENFPKVSAIIAHVKHDNPASGRMFEKAGYKQVENSENLEYRFILK